jgi:hypothetical protein
MNSKGKQMKADPSRYDMRSELEDKSGFKVLGNSHVFKYDEHGGWYDEFSNYYNKANKPSNPPGVKQKPDGSRFEKFTLTKDETGFTIPGVDRVYYFDVYGGWYDEFDNYYSKEGVPGAAPEYSDSDRTFDKFEREYDDYDDDDEDDIQADYAKEANRKRLENMKGDVEFQVKNINYKATEDDFEDFLKKEKIEFVTFEFEYLDDGRSRGVAYVTLTKANAEKFIDLDNKALKGRKIAISLWNDKSEGSQSDVEAHEDEIITKQDNKINLDAYEAEDVVEVELANLDEKTTVDDIRKYLTDNKITVDDVDPAFDKETYAPHVAAFIYLAKNQAEKLLALSQHKILGREVEFIVSEPGYNDEEEEEEGEEGQPEESKAQ